LPKDFVGDLERVPGSGETSLSGRPRPQPPRPRPLFSRNVESNNSNLYKGLEGFSELDFFMVDEKFEMVDPFYTYKLT
jgi:hypothetical protein